jgi:hypothetical protein
VGATDAAITPYDFGVRGGIHRDVQIIISDAGGAIEGRARDDRGNPVQSFAAVAFATNRDLWFEQSPYTKSARVGDEGLFRITGLPPGEYFVAAAKRIDTGPLSGDLNDPELLEQLASQAERVTIGEREQKIVTVPLARR